MRPEGGQEPRGAGSSLPDHLLATGPATWPVFRAEGPDHNVLDSPDAQQDHSSSWPHTHTMQTK